MDKSHIYVEIPYGTEIAYTLHTDGFMIEKPKAIDNGDFMLFKYPLDSIVVLFYNFQFSDKESKIKKTRRLYVITAKEIIPGKRANTALPGVNVSVNVLFSARGRTVDYFKHIMNTLRNLDDFNVYRMPCLFWYKLFYVAKYCNGNEFDTLRLYKKYRNIK